MANFQKTSLLFLALWVIQYSHIEAWDIICNNDAGLIYEDPADCSSYFMCLDNNNYIHITCASGEYYDSSTRKCLSGSCSENSTQPPTETTTELETSSESSTQTSTEPSIPTSSEIPSEGTTIPTPFQCASEGKYPNPSNCHKYYQCFSNGKSIEIDCGPTQYYDQVLQDCRSGSC